MLVSVTQLSNGGASSELRASIDMIMYTIPESAQLSIHIMYTYSELINYYTVEPCLSKPLQAEALKIC